MRDDTSGADFDILDEGSRRDDIRLEDAKEMLVWGAQQWRKDTDF